MTISDRASLQKKADVNSSVRIPDGSGFPSAVPDKLTIHSDGNFEQLLLSFLTTA